MDIYSEKYTAQSVGIATGATAKQISDWCAQGLILGQRDRLGKGHAREFSWSNVMEVAIALALMEIGVNAPGDAFRASQRFAHTGVAVYGGGLDEDVLDRRPGLPYHHTHGDTWLYVAGAASHVALHKDGAAQLSETLRILGNPPGFIAVDLSALFAVIARRFGHDFREVLDHAYPVI